MRSQGQNTVMKGGAREAILDIISKQWSPIEVYILVFLILSIVFVRESALFAASIFVSMYYSWLNGLFIALFTLLILSMSPRNEEGFQDKKASVKIVDNARPWWVEAVLKENPIAFEDDRITTSAIQDGATSNRSNSTTSSP